MDGWICFNLEKVDDLAIIFNNLMKKPVPFENY